MRVIVSIMLIIFGAASLSGCTFFGFSHKTVSGLICKENFEIGQQCIVYDPLLRQQVPIDPISGVSTTCNLSVDKKYYNCYYTYSDAMGNSWSGKLFRENK